jgi:hypothetical protein
VEQGIDSISLNPDSLLKTTVAIIDAERRLAERGESSQARLKPPEARRSTTQPVVTGASQ